MKKLTKNWQSRAFWKNLSNFWGLVAILLFLVDFFSFHVYDVASSSVAVIYIGVLSLYVGSKEFYRWKTKGKFQSKYFGEIHVIFWTIVMAIFVIIGFLSHGLLNIPPEFIATYISVLGIFAISQQSKSFKLKG
ncbi:MAG: hypothetical protein COV55_03795 [Candidatus Komeilibacteria bacterium CG11_big_fil_rev_8_21_14_0_20_36_20]|uniref:Uncharacterized protein n=1 Tax=Candidatus Komeilibacteria bacterium CG11_big_fil_rev_8_21_14_0_20_36_20 TaxID=1974477 RepID=A0A2H0NCJ8_9BACT|nr:MAG: hypothetical protein COV55_03795 [Candidatus Komeilibacteria bacterium CG11_big_fil_rev_8_21_14_0_20_36_20]PIR81953.1 MAG: hypothetical protein COU21_01240 [Candidatus Komeilibacteria bacterium CG10_big_fil_rev_8_21_14_0_10_36_65]PJC55485.1 MAG: hypothetical protein CO027_01920 [Candidatus Komeilibacteria bacterium CG_4_9_14_0_2_um_filter_36_13]